MVFIFKRVCGGVVNLMGICILDDTEIRHVCSGAD